MTPTKREAEKRRGRAAPVRRPGTHRRRNSKVRATAAKGDARAAARRTHGRPQEGPEVTAQLEVMEKRRPWWGVVTCAVTVGSGVMPYFCRPGVMSWPLVTMTPWKDPFPVLCLAPTGVDQLTQGPLGV
jgi:hypothetical protein